MLEEMIMHQKEKLLKLAKEIDPKFIEDDLMQPFDFKELESHPDFRYEEGFLAALLSVAAAYRASGYELTCLK